MPYHELEAISSDYHDKCKECLREMLAAWLRGARASPARLVQALKNAGMSVLARKMAVKYGKSICMISEWALSWSPCFIYCRSESSCWTNNWTWSWGRIYWMHGCAIVCFITCRVLSLILIILASNILVFTHTTTCTGDTGTSEERAYKEGSQELGTHSTTTSGGKKGRRSQ